MKLRPYQEKMMEDARGALRKGHRRILITAPTGAGKTVVLATKLHNFLERGEGSALYVVHRRQLVLQTAGVLERMGVPATIVMAGHQTDWSKRVFVVSRDTWERRKKWINFGDVGMIIFDEAHIGINAQKRIVDALRPRVVLGYTATPTTMTGPGMGALYDAIVHGPSYDELIAQGYLVPTEWVVASPIDKSGLRVSRATGDYALPDVVKLVKGQVLYDLYDAYAAHGGERTVIFAPTVDIAATIAARLGNSGIPAAVVDWSTPPKHRAYVLNAFREGKLKVLVNVDVFSEGWDEPLVDTIILANPTRSLARHLQRIGRGMRPAPGKHSIRIIDLVGVVFEHGAPEDITGWELEPARPDRNRARPTPPVKRKGLCPICRHEMNSVPCPNCGFAPEYKPVIRDLEVVGGMLVDMDSEAMRKHFYSQLRYWARLYGKKEGWAAHAYRYRYGEWPPYEWRRLPLVPPTESTERFIKHLLIRWAKRREMPWEGRFFRRE